jgi:hypothetical protein
MAEKCEKCGQHEKGGWGVFYYAQKLGSRVVGNSPLGDSQPLTRVTATSTSYKVLGSKKLFICDGCVKRERWYRFFKDFVFLLIMPILIFLVLGLLIPGQFFGEDLKEPWDSIRTIFIIYVFGSIIFFFSTSWVHFKKYANDIRYKMAVKLDPYPNPGNTYLDESQYSRLR